MEPGEGRLAPLLLRWGQGAPHSRHCHVPTPRTDFAPPRTQATWERVQGLQVKSPPLFDLSFPICKVSGAGLGGP